MKFLNLFVVFFVLFVVLAAGRTTIKRGNIETVFLSDMILKFITLILKGIPPTSTFSIQTTQLV